MRDQYPYLFMIERVGQVFDWITMITIPFLVLFAIILGIQHFSKRNGIENKKELPVSTVGMIVKLIIPYSLFAGMFGFNKHLVGYTCLCFANYEWIIVDFLAFIFFIGSFFVSYLMRKNKKEWKILYTLLFIISFLGIFYSVMAIGDYFYLSEF